MDQRQQLLHNWIVSAFEQLGIDLDPDWRLQPVSGDASFRRYFRVLSHNLSWIAVDAPPEKENSQPFVDIARAWEPLEIHAPQVHLANLEQGFMLLSDLGDVLYLDRLDDQSADLLYGQAMQTLTHIQQCRTILGEPLPAYDRALLQREMELFRDWFVGQLLGLTLTTYEQKLLDSVFESLIVSALAQPQVCVHRDYHSRNLMVIDGSAPGVIDFQDAVFGPVTYDLVSLLRDCYIDWPADRVQGWALDYADLAQQAGLMESVSPQRFLGWFDRMGMQRHLKAIGIFA
ncbi:MAG: phosphotransferase, partial [Halopseudomonas sp.]